MFTESCTLPVFSPLDWLQFLPIFSWSASPGPKEEAQVLYQALRAVFPKEPYSAA